MFSHVMVGTDDMEQSKAFYDALLGSLGHPPGFIDEKGRCFYKTRTGIFAISIPINGEPASFANGSTIGFAADSPEQVEAWHATGLANGGTTCEDPPGVRASGAHRVYLAYLRDPAGNKICALHDMA